MNEEATEQVHCCLSLPRLELNLFFLFCMCVCAVPLYSRRSSVSEIYSFNNRVYTQTHTHTNIDESTSVRMIICSELGLCVLFFPFNSSVFILCEIEVILAKVWKCFPQLSLGTTHEYIFTNTVLCLHTLCITLHTANVYYEHRSSKVIACFILLFFVPYVFRKKANEMIKKQNIHVHYLFCISVALWCKYAFLVEYYCAIDTFCCGVKNFNFYPPLDFDHF